MRKNRSLPLPAAVILVALSCFVTVAHAGTYYVAESGSDTSGDGTTAKPWATIVHASKQIPDDGSTILVGPGTYTGRILLSRAFSQLTTIRAEPRYRAVLKNPGGEILSCFIKGPAKLRIEGFEITAGKGFACTQRENYLIHFQDVTDIWLVDNIIHDAAVAGNCNELLKVNSGSPNVAPKNVHIVGNVFYNPAPIGGADLIDCKAIEDIDISDNIFFAETPQTKSTSYVMIKDEKLFTDGRTLRSPRFRVQRNVFVGWQGAADQAFILFGEDGKPYHEVTDSLIENNLLIGNSTTPIVGAFQLKGVKDVTIRANTIVGDLPGGSYALRAGTEAANPSVEGVRLLNNIFADPTGTMTKRLVNTYGNAILSTFALTNNLYWNGGGSLQGYFTNGTLKPEDDAAALFGDPKLPGDQSAVVLPLWNATAGTFQSGETTIRAEFVRLVQTYGTLGSGSAAAGKADASEMPADDILGRPRGAQPSVGAFEVNLVTTSDGGSTDTLVMDGGSDGDGGAKDALLPGDGNNRDSAGSGDAGVSKGDDSGCGCQLSAPPSGTGAILLLLLLGLLSRRQR